MVHSRRLAAGSSTTAHGKKTWDSGEKREKRENRGEQKHSPPPQKKAKQRRTTKRIEEKEGKIRRNEEPYQGFKGQRIAGAKETAPREESRVEAENSERREGFELRTRKGSRRGESERESAPTG